MTQGFVFWQPCLSHHQAAYFRGLERLGFRVTLAVEERVYDFRRAMGWSEPDCGRAEIVVAPEAACRARLLDRGADWIHVFTPSHAYPIVRAGFREAVRRPDLTVGIFSEGFRRWGLTGALRRARGRIDAARFADDVAFVLAVGHLGVDWFRGTGFPAERVYRFGYVTNRPEGCCPEPGRDPYDATYRVGFVGTLRRLKQVDLLVEALAPLDGAWSLTLVGDGPEREPLAARAEALGIADRVRFVGYVDSDVVGAHMDDLDLLVLPSAWDGWGAVVNEALMCGLPVVCSDRCGAADLLREPWRGDVFPHRDVAALRAILARRIADPASRAQRRRIRAWSDALTGDAAARYVVEVVEHARRGGSRPRPPWMA